MRVAEVSCLNCEQAKVEQGGNAWRCSDASLKHRKARVWATTKTNSWILESRAAACGGFISMGQAYDLAI